MSMHHGPYSPTRAYDYRFNRTRELLFTPQPGWNGLDYYKAYAPNPDPALYHRVLEGQYGTKGVGLYDAMYWHQQIYESLGDIRAYLPHLGHAAAYEAFRIWIHNRSKLDLGSDYSQRREAFIAIAIAEACRIFQTAQVHHEQRVLREVCETAAATASIIFQTLSDDESLGGNRRPPSPASRQNSPSRDESPDDRGVLHGSRSHSRRSSSASSSRPAVTPPVSGSPNQPTSSIPIQANNHNGGPPWNPYSGWYPQYATATYPQQYPGGVQGVPIVGSTYSQSWGLFYPNAGFYQTPTYIQVHPGLAQYYPPALGSLVIIQQPARRSSRREAFHIVVTQR